MLNRIDRIDWQFDWHGQSGARVNERLQLVWRQRLLVVGRLRRHRRPQPQQVNTRDSAAARIKLKSELTHRACLGPALLSPYHIVYLNRKEHEHVVAGHHRFSGLCRPRSESDQSDAVEVCATLEGQLRLQALLARRRAPLARGSDEALLLAIGGEELRRSGERVSDLLRLHGHQLHIRRQHRRRQDLLQPGQVAHADDAQRPVRHTLLLLRGARVHRARAREARLAEASAKRRDRERVVSLVDTGHLDHMRTARYVVNSKRSPSILTCTAQLSCSCSCC